MQPTPAPHVDQRTEPLPDDASIALGDDTGRAVSVSARGLVVVLPAGRAGEAGRTWSEAMLTLGGRRRRLGEVVLKGVETDDADGDERAELEVLEPASRAVLWDLRDRLGNARVAAEGASNSEHPGTPPDQGHFSELARQRRLGWIREHTGAELPSLDEVSVDPTQLKGNIENLVGTVEVPVGLAGPLLFRGEHAQGYITAPLATTEGALVASASRGAKAVTRGGGVATRVLKQRMHRAPLYQFRDVVQAQRFVRWVADHLDGVREQIGLVSRHARLVRVEPMQAGRVVHLLFSYETGDAAGQNMTTACTWRACQWINAEIALVPRLEIEAFYVEGNASGDKKLSQLSLTETRGTRVTAECRLDGATVREVLKTTPDAMLSMNRWAAVGGLMSGMTGYSINVANTVAAMFTATGQDIACVHESGSGIFTIEPRGDGLYAMLVLPALVVGTVGGGTGLPHQRDYLELLGCAGADRAPRLAEIIAGFALALDLSTLAAVSGGQFADAHQRLGRNRPVEWFTAKDLTPPFFQPLLATTLERPQLEVAGATRLDPFEHASILSELGAQAAREKLVGIVPVSLQLGGDDGPEHLDVVVKAKALDDEVILGSNRIASLCGGRLAESYSRYRDWTGFKGCHLRELALCRAPVPPLREVMPRVYGVHEDPEREAYVIVMEALGDQVTLKDTADDVSGWTREHVDAALKGIAGVHAHWLGREQELLAEPWLGPVRDAAKMGELTELWVAVAEHNATEFPHWIDELDLMRGKRMLATCAEWFAELEAMPRTLVHNDFNPRNIALRRDGLKLVAYDWELATLHVPQRDLAELLAFVLPPDAEPAVVDHHVEVHRLALEQAAGASLDPERWRRGYHLALADFIFTRLGLYLMAHTQRSQPFLDRVVPTTRRLLEIETQRDIGVRVEARQRARRGAHRSPRSGAEKDASLRRVAGERG